MFKITIENTGIGFRFEQMIQEVDIGDLIKYINQRHPDPKSFADAMLKDTWNPPPRRPND